MVCGEASVESIGNISIATEIGVKVGTADVDASSGGAIYVTECTTMGIVDNIGCTTEIGTHFFLSSINVTLPFTLVSISSGGHSRGWGLRGEAQQLEGVGRFHKVH